MVVEAYPVFDALCMNGLYPGIITDPGSGSGFSANGYALDDRARATDSSLSIPVVLDRYFLPGIKTTVSWRIRLIFFRIKHLTCAKMMKYQKRTR